MADSSPIRYGFDAVKKTRGLFLIEIAWRWTFGLLATLLLVLGTTAFIARLNISPADAQVIRGPRPTPAAAAALVHVFEQNGVWRQFFLIAAAVVFPSTLIWIIAATIGRVAVLRRLFASPQVDTAAVLYLTIARAGLLFACVALWFGWMVLCAFLTMSGEEPNYPLYLLLSFLALPVVAVVWGMLNWVLSLAPVLVARDRLGALASYRSAVRLVRREKATFVSVTSWLGMARLMVMIAALVIALLFLLVFHSADTVTIMLTIVTLLYCAFADYLYVVRLAAYSQIGGDRSNIFEGATPSAHLLH
jgi:hypothetical protein